MTLIAFAVIIVTVVVARLPTTRFFRDWRIKLPSLVFIFAFFRGEGVVEIVHAFRIVRGWLVRVKPFTNLLFLALLGVRLTAMRLADGCKGENGMEAYIKCF